VDDRDRLDERIAEIVGLMLAEESLDTVLARVMSLATATIEVTDFGGVSLLRERRVTTAAVTDDRTNELDAVQYRLDEGPCLQAIRDSRTYGIPDTFGEQRFPRFASEAATHGVRSTLSLPLLVKHKAVGALNLYSLRSESFNEHHYREGQYLAERVAVSVANAAFVDATTQLVTQLNMALASRAVIEQAKGILMAREKCSADDAFDILRRASQHRNRKLREIAEDLVRGIGPAPAAGSASAADLSPATGQRQ
jgi:transcriptional regulator with GAF, ATPase, and Fis domain